MKLLCDEMLKRLGRWLRAAGHDTLIASDGSTDRELLHLALKEHRTLITRDQKLLELKHADKAVVLLRSNATHDSALELRRLLGVDWLYQPFSRCLLCNAPLIAAPADQLRRIPPRSARTVEEVRYCQHCDKLYWLGSHVRRMRRVLERWQAAPSAPPASA